MSGSSKQLRSAGRWAGRLTRYALLGVVLGVCATLAQLVIFRILGIYAPFWYFAAAATAFLIPVLLEIIRALCLSFGGLAKDSWAKRHTLGAALAFAVGFAVLQAVVKIVLYNNSDVLLVALTSLPNLALHTFLSFFVLNNLMASRPVAGVLATAVLWHMLWNGSIVAYSVLTERGLIAIDELFVALPLTAVFLALLWWAVANRRAPA